MALAPVKLTLIAGRLGSGKTSLINRLIAGQPAAERWVVIQAESGPVALDPGQADVVARDLGGGCLCCAAGPPLQVMIVELVRRHRPDRLLIELAGGSHLARVIALLEAPPLGNALDRRATLALIDAADGDAFELRAQAEIAIEARSGAADPAWLDLPSAYGKT